MENTATLETLINLACTNLKVDLSELQAVDFCVEL